MRVAALNDVHGNLPALEAVLAEVPEDAAIVLGGDIAAGPFPAGTLEPAAGFPGHIGDDRPSKAEFLALCETVVVGR